MIDAETTLKLIQEVAADQPEHFVEVCSYAKYDENEGYLPNCIVGVVLNRLGATPDQLFDLDTKLGVIYTTGARGRVREATDVEFSQPAIKLLAVAQALQDTGHDSLTGRVPELDEEDQREYELLDSANSTMADHEKNNLRRKWKYAAKAAEEVFLAH